VRKARLSSNIEDVMITDDDLALGVDKFNQDRKSQAIKSEHS